MFRRFYNNRAYRTYSPVRARATDNTRFHGLAGNLYLLQTSYLIFNGTDSYVELPTGDIIPQAHDFTIEFWFGPNSDTNHQRIWTQSGNAQEPMTVSFVNGYVALFGGVGHSLLWPGLEEYSWTWRHYAFVRKDGTVKGYKGSMLASQDSAPTEGTSLINAFGCRDGTRSFLKGRLHDFRIWNFAMPVWQLYSIGLTVPRHDDPRLYAYWPMDEGSGTTVTDVTGNGWDGVAHNCTWGT